MRVYLIGPMTGLPKHNYPAFFKVEQEILAAGHVPLSPARHGLPTHLDRAVYMRMSFSLLMQAEAIHLLDGWQESAGARLELDMATELDLWDWRRITT